MNLFVANFDKDTSEGDLERLFRRYGKVTEVRIWIDNKTGDSREFGFVEMPDKHEAREAIGELNDFLWGGRRLRVSKARNQD